MPLRLKALSTKENAAPAQASSENKAKKIRNIREEKTTEEKKNDGKSRTRCKMARSVFVCIRIMGMERRILCKSPAP